MKQFIVNTVVDAYQSYWIMADTEDEAKETLERIFREGPQDIDEQRILDSCFTDSSYGDEEIISVEEWNEED
jgi:hypothetical protein